MKKKTFTRIVPIIAPPPLAKTRKKKKIQKSKKSPKTFFLLFWGTTINSWKTDKYIENTSKYTRGR